MERKQILNTKKRVFSPKPNNNPSIFVQKYINYLLPALQNLNMNKPSSSSQINHQTVKHEVDKALALSTQEFAWSRFLKQKLSSSNSCCLNEKRLDKEEEIEIEIEIEEEGEEIKKRLRELQKLLPGGEEMNNVEEMLSEISSYIVCLELQMIVLKSLVQETI